MVADRYGRGSRSTLDEAPLPDGELSHLLTRSPVLDEHPSYDLRGTYHVENDLLSVFSIVEN